MLLLFPNDFKFCAVRKIINNIDTNIDINIDLSVSYPLDLF